MKSRPTDDGELHLGYFFPAGKTNFLYSDEAARRTPDMTKPNLVALARAAEQTGFDTLFIADNWSGHQRAAESAGHQSPAYHAPLLAMALLTATDHIGVISTFHTTYHKPAHVARMGATLDAFSNGRWGWNVVTGFSADEAALFGEDFVEHDERYQMAAEFTDIVIKLWNENEAIEVDGVYYKARGRIKMPRPVQQPNPLLVSAGASPAGMAFAAQFCDQLVTLASDEDALRTVDTRLTAATATTGRRVTTCPFAIALVREEEGRAQEEWERLRGSLNPAATKEIAADVLGSIESSRAQYEAMGEEQATMAFGGAGSMLKLIGTPEQVAEQLISIKRNTSATNILINFPLWSPEELAGFTPVVSHLRDAGVWTPPDTRDYSW
ncbi:luciferase-like domain-containing flavin monooxygenase [Nocardia nova SH22a]|uniref:Luciferase-like domain-containing flavin monooxygenase n=1 Tax=Nocardia nova SH22a TaxID=1415166 RepID=W5TLB3_9NOCA|nr:LLM class flavin-dependent oxidoreductase [Nocardia nova]AHH19919.1 luciferase-like domain-containing flavin monooxygenase [Nocardia nova SH22a]